MTARESQDIPRRIADLDGQDAYALLGVRPDASPDDITAAYRREMALAHPNRGGSARRAQLVNCAFDVLTRHRDDYDELLDAHPGPRTHDPAEAAGPDVLQVDPDAEPLDDPLPPGAGWWWWSARGLLVGSLAVVVLAVVVLAVAFSRGGSPAPGQDTAWTTGEAAPAGPTSIAPASAGPASVGPAAAGPEDPAASSWSVAATVVVAVASAPAAGGGHRCEVRGDGSLWCVGGNARGQLGDGSTRNAEEPVRVAAPPDVRWSAVAVGGRATCALHEDGSLWCWGDNDFGQVGDGTNSSRTAPVAVDPEARWLEIAVDTHACAVRTDHTLWCWGAARQGEIGDGLRADQASPRRLGAEATWADVSVGPGWTCAVRQNRARQCWGEGYPPAPAG